MKFGHYYFLSLVATLSTILYAIYTREQFYPIVLFLVSSKVSYIVNANCILANTMLLGKILVSLFFGKVRGVEIELLQDQGKYTIIEICIALTLFRNDGLLNPTFLAWLWILLFTKVD